MENLDAYTSKAIELLMTYGPKLILAIIVLLIGLWVINKVVNLSSKMMEKRGIDPSLLHFLKSLANILLKALLLISVASMIGIETTSFVAMLGAAGLAVGLALQGTLANFAGGVLILFFKPYKVGDLIQAQGHLGHVKEIQVFVTILLTPENKTVIIPNGAISNGDITNYTTQGLIRVDLVMGISYAANIKAARTALMEVMTQHPKVLETPAPFVGVKELGNSSVNLAVRPYCNPEDYWAVYFDIYEQGKEALDAAGITIPFPQLDLYIKEKP
ncbi:mechanosensitive ion channel domain-containing protein [Rapidithrix thailandica]|uniref:Mechanosensitive ion channel domain-containing protein n=1 Tax=Rapidithrix thailandica TaxID=413964 RepID=A0AAW9S9I2_9BACT